MLKKIIKFWNKITEGAFGYIIYALLGIFLAYFLNFTFGYILNTKLPFVVVVSNSMSHFPNSHICGTFIENYKNNFNDYWLACNETYKAFNITKEEFFEFPFKNGLEIGDVVVIKGEKEYKVGEVIVYKPLNEKYPVIHRIVKINEDGTYQTKGDRNNSQLYYEKSISLKQIYGKAIFRIPLIGLPRVLVAWVIGI